MLKQTTLSVYYLDLLPGKILFICSQMLFFPFLKILMNQFLFLFSHTDISTHNIVNVNTLVLVIEAHNTIIIIIDHKRKRIVYKILWYDIHGKPAQSQRSQRIYDHRKIHRNTAELKVSTGNNDRDSQDHHRVIFTLVHAGHPHGLKYIPQQDSKDPHIHKGHMHNKKRCFLPDHIIGLIQKFHRI